MRKFIATVVDILELKKPYKVVYRFLKKDRAAEYIAYHDKKGRVVEHAIRINQAPGGNRSVKALIAHEFIHAWQEENGYNDMHGKPFQGMAEFLSLELAYHGFSVKGLIYDKEVDL